MIEFAFRLAWYATWRAAVIKKLPHDHGNTVNGLETIRRSISYSLAKSA
jgi:hypothetical protein